jgi:hypothetical protein
MTQEQAINKLRLWYGWHGYSEAERECGKFLRRLNAAEILAECLAVCPKMPPKKARRV